MSSGFIESFAPLLIKLKKYFLEIILLTVSLIITIAALAVYVKNNQENTDQEVINNSQPEQTLSGNIFVDVSGAVKKPNVYQMVFGARLKDIIDKADGLSDEADVIFFNRNFNLARIIADQEKIYIPSIMELNNGVFIENSRTFDYTSPRQSSNVVLGTAEAPQDKVVSININTAAIEELDQLPGIGQVTANKIINNRPYSTINELLTKKVVNKSVYEKIKDLITTN